MDRRDSHVLSCVDDDEEGHERRAGLDCDVEVGSAPSQFQPAVRRRKGSGQRRSIQEKEGDRMLTHLKINGINCEHCRGSVEKAILEIQGIERLEISLESGDCNIWHDPSVSAVDIAEAVRGAGFEAEVQSVMRS